jgi:hypothetical protein
MPTAKELRLQAKECLELARASNEYFVRTALTELARELHRQARQAEREHEIGAHSHLQAQSR